jgi:peptide/nickel transport system substrate-binding protein
MALFAVLSASAMIAGACRADSPGSPKSSSSALRVGVAQLSATNPISGLRQLSQNLSVDGLARVSEDGRLEPSLAEQWTLANERRSLVMKLRRGVKFHDGSALTSETVAALLPGALKSTFGSIAEDVEDIRAIGDNSIEIQFRRPSPFLLESLEAPIRKPGESIVGTGPFMVASNSTFELRANPDYYLGPPKIDTIRIQMFPAVRTAWAELLRDRLDMLYEVGPDALDSLESSKNVAVFTFTRRYQYVVAFNTRAAPLRSSAVRQALNLAVDRDALVAQGLKTHGQPSSGPIWPPYWAMRDRTPTFDFNPARAEEILRRGQRPLSKGATVRFTCLVSPDATEERIALELKRQLAAVGVDMIAQAASRDAIVEALQNRSYEAILLEAISGPTLLRPYLLWHSRGAMNNAGFGTAGIDAAFDRVRSAETEAAYLDAVTSLKDAFRNDPPAIFLAWNQRARAVSTRFAVPTPEPGRDILSTLRLWQRTGSGERASRN